MERLRALEDMAAGISHSLNNLLTGILVPAQLVQRRTNNPQVLNDIETILNSGWRARDLVQRLHQATQFEDSGDKQPVSVNDALQDVIRETRPQWKEGPREKGILISVTTRLEHLPPFRERRTDYAKSSSTCCSTRLTRCPRAEQLRFIHSLWRQTCRLASETPA